MLGFSLIDSTFVAIQSWRLKFIDTFTLLMALEVQIFTSHHFKKKTIEKVTPSVEFILYASNVYVRQLKLLNMVCFAERILPGFIQCPNLN